MGKYINYERIQRSVSKEGLNELLIQIIKNDQEIIHYSERIMDVDSIQVIIICGKLNEGKRIL